MGFILGDNRWPRRDATWRPWSFSLRSKRDDCWAANARHWLQERFPTSSTTSLRAKAPGFLQLFVARLKPRPLDSSTAHLVDFISNQLKTRRLGSFRAVRILRIFRPIRPCRAVLHDNGKSV